MNRQESPFGPCVENRPFLEAYHDGEVGDAAIKTAIETHLRECAACREELRALVALDEQLKSLPMLKASEVLKVGIGNVDSKAARGGWAKRMRGSRRSKWVASGVIAATAMLAALGAWQWSLQGGNVARRTDAHDDLLAFIEDHVAYVQSDSAPVWETDDPAEMERWFGGHLEFTPKLPRWPWAELVSGRLCFIHGKRVARMQYRGAGADLTLFIQRDEAERETEADSLAMERTLRGYTVRCWKDSDQDYVLVAPSSAGEVFEQLGKAG